MCRCLRETYTAYDKLLMESAAKAAGTVVSCPACGDYSEYQPEASDADGFPLQPVQLFRCVKCLQVTAAAALLLLLQLLQTHWLSQPLSAAAAGKGYWLCSVYTVP